MKFRSVMLDDSHEEYVYRTFMTLTDVTVKNLGKYYCIFNESLERNPEADFEGRVIDYEATSIYVFVNGKK